MRVLVTSARMPFAPAQLHFREHEALFEAMARDITWDGDPIDGMSAEDALVLESLGAQKT
jgi:hypothetical protein